MEDRIKEERDQASRKHEIKQTLLTSSNSYEEENQEEKE